MTRESAVTGARSRKQGAIGGGEQQQPARQPAQPAQLADDDAGVLGDLAGDRLLDQLRVAERDGDRGTQLVGGVEQEQPLPVQQNPRRVAESLPGLSARRG
jgi:hypothetical protein